MGPSVTNNPSAATSAAVTPTTTNPLADQSFSGASTNVAGFRTNLAALATATALAVGTNEVANAQTNVNSGVQHGAPTTLVTPGTNQIVYTSVQLPGQPAPNKVVNFQPVSLRELKDLSVVYDARGRQLTLDRSVVPAEGDSRSGPPSKGEVVRLLSTGILALKEKNNLKITDPIPAGSVVVVTIQGKFGATTLPINADLFPRPDRVSEQAFRTADRDQYNRKAITELAQERGGDLSIRVTHEPGGVASIKYNQDIKFELMPMPKP